MKALQYALLLILFPTLLEAQAKKMTPEVYEEWHSIDNEQISNKGNWVSYFITNEAGKSELNLYNTRTRKNYKFDRAKKATFDIDEKFIAFHITAHPDTIKEMKRRKMKKSKMPKDTLCIFNLANKNIERIPNVDGYRCSKDFPGHIAFKLAKKTMKQDSTLVKDEGKDNGTVLVVKNVEKNKSKVIPFVKTYNWSEDKGYLVFHSTGEDTINRDRILLYDAGLDRMKTVLEADGDYQHFAFDKKSEQLAFIANTDTTEHKDNRHELMLYTLKSGSSKSIAGYGSSMMEKNWQVSEHQRPYFLDASDLLVFGSAPILPKEDTTLLEEEKVHVEVWHYQDGLLHTQQENNRKSDLRKSYQAIYNPSTRKVVQLSDLDIPSVRISKTTTADYVIGTNNEAYQKYLSWEGRDYHDVYVINLATGEKKLLGEKVSSRPRISPDGDYITWYSVSDTSWYSQNLQTKKVTQLTKGSFYDELNDRPMYPRPSGTVAWSDSNESILYDHYDIWKVDITGGKEPQRLTDGRSSNVRYRYISLDNEVTILPSDTTILVSSFNFDNKSSGYAYLNLGTGVMQKLLEGPFRYGTRILKAKESDDIVYTKESWDVFPDLIHSDLTFHQGKRISDANPQQAAYGWGSMELYEWVDVDGITRKALLVKPPNFNPAKKYPLMVNFYEKSSDRLYNHRAPYAHRSTINYSYYANRGYVIFNPDVYYKDGYPGESCYDAIMASVDQLVDEGFIDEDNMGLQGHSWGGYQIAYLLTKTDRFKCAESGAPVVNMVSAYGGIRWGSGMSRMFQYEKTQSRLGATLWERPDLYLYNSPVFQLDKVETPVLILHNDKDGAVPWYQGIEYFVGLRRLGKPAWMLNYNDEPHWPVKKQNRLDFNKRMEQFFDHYLMGEKIPIWMKDGIPVVKKGVIDGLEYSDEH